MTTEEYILEVEKINPNVEVIDQYIDSNTKILHRCKKCEYIWKVRPSAIKYGRGCPNCSRHQKVSLKESKFFYYIKKYFPDAVNGFSDVSIGLSELDIYIPSIKYGFEFDGMLYHQDIRRDKRKDEICNISDIKLIRIRENGCPTYNSTCTFVYLNDNSDSCLQTTIIHVLEALGVNNPDVNFKRDIAEINNQYYHRNLGDQSLASCFPIIAAEWHPTKNGDLKPEYIYPGSKEDVWWKCSKCQNEWQKAVFRRTIQNKNCPRCAYHGVPTMVYCYETQEIFDSISEASRYYGIDNRRISRCCFKKCKFAGLHPITGEELHWYYVEDKLDKGEIVTQGAISLGFITQEYVNSFTERRKA